MYILYHILEYTANEPYNRIHNRTEFRNNGFSVPDNPTMKYESIVPRTVEVRLDKTESRKSINDCYCKCFFIKVILLRMCSFLLCK